MSRSPPTAVTTGGDHATPSAERLVSTAAPVTPPVSDSPIEVISHTPCRAS
ncbi:hypothetical protein [Nonomuraea salmonea]|uniref:hypothetical protein n=1 Tax=Nonomuraea salmonea TaxID=46181 RepID=UPI0031ECE0DC